MTGRNPVREASAVRKAIVYLLLLSGIPTLMLAEDIGWPREMTQNSARICYCQPQSDQWQDYRTLDARIATSVTPPGGKATPSVVSFQARTDANKETRTIVNSNIKWTDTRFPAVDAASAAKAGELVRAFFKPEEAKSSDPRYTADRIHYS